MEMHYNQNFGNQKQKPNFEAAWEKQLFTSKQTPEHDSGISVESL